MNKKTRLNKDWEEPRRSARLGPGPAAAKINERRITAIEIVNTQFTRNFQSYQLFKIAAQKNRFFCRKIYESDPLFFNLENLHFEEKNFTSN